MRQGGLSSLRPRHGGLRTNGAWEIEVVEIVEDRFSPVEFEEDRINRTFIDSVTAPDAVPGSFVSN